MREQEQTRRIPLLAIVMMCLSLSFALYSPAITAEAVLDDTAAVLENPLVQGPLDIQKIFETNVFGNRAGYAHIPLSRPLTTLSYRIGDPKRLDHHRIGNIFLHGCNSVLVFIFSSTLGASGWIAGSAALLFTVHPVHTDAVVPLNNRSDLFCTLLLLSSLIFWWRSQGVLGGLCALALAILAPFTKEQGVIAPILFAIPMFTNLLEDKKVAKWRWSILGLAILSVLLFFALRQSLLGAVVPSSISPSDNPLASFESLHRIAASGYLLAYGARLLFMPNALSADYSMGSLELPSSFWDPSALGGVLVLIFSMGGLLWLAIQRRSLLFALLGAAFLSYLPGSNILTPSTILFSERALYLPSAFFLIAIVVRISQHAEEPTWKRSAVLALILATGMFSWWTYLRASEHKNAFELASSSLRATPGSARLLSLLGSEYQLRGERERARVEFSKALENDPGCASAMHGLGSIAMQGHDFKKAAKWFESAMVATGASEPQIVSHTCAAQLRAGLVAAAKTSCERARTMTPHDPAPTVNLARAEIMSGNYSKALLLLKTLTESASPPKSALAQLIQLYLSLDNKLEAERIWQQARKLFPSDPRIKQLGKNAGLRSID